MNQKKAKALRRKAKDFAHQNLTQDAAYDVLKKVYNDTPRNLRQLTKKYRIKGN